jgi:hypothetical protein
MAKYRTTVESKMSPDETFEYLADFANAPEWDPGVVEGERLDDGPLGVGSRFQLVARFLGRSVPLEYRIVALERPRRVVFEADERTVHSIDEIRFAPKDSGTAVTYEADLRLKGRLGRALDPVLALVFSRIGDRATGGLREVLGA